MNNSGSKLRFRTRFRIRIWILQFFQGLKNLLKKNFNFLCLGTSVADPDPGSGAFLTLDLDPGSGIGFFPDPRSRISDPVSRIPDPNPIIFRA
jgi:hypothetical protein